MRFYRAFNKRGLEITEAENFQRTQTTTVVVGAHINPQNWGAQGHCTKGV